MNPGDNGKDDDDGTHTTFYEELLEEAEWSERDKPTRPVGACLTAVICICGWVGIWLVFRSCFGG